MQKNSAGFRALFFCVSIILPQASLAQGKGGGIMLGIGHVYPELELRTLYDDNLLRAPGRELQTLIGIDNRLRAEYEYTPTSRISAAVRGEYLDTHDPRGTGRSEGVVGTIVETDPDEWHHWAIEANAAYGAKTAKGRIEADIGYTGKTYDNNRGVTYVRDRDDTYGAARLYYGIRPKTDVVLEARATEFNYDRSAPGSASLDSLGTTLLAGVTWDATFKTTGYAKIGLIDKDFDSSRRKDDDDFAWEMGVVWNPRTYSSFTLETSSGYLETNGTGDLISHDEINFGWNHQWRARLNTQVYFSYAEDTFGLDPREDELINAGALVNYEMRRWLKLGAGYMYDERDSNTNLFDYDRNLFEVSANITL
jgi:hypothetical protein